MLKRIVKQQLQMIENEGGKIIEVDPDRKHTKVVVENPKGIRHPFFLTKTPSDHRAVANFRSHVRRFIRAEA